MNRKLTFAAGLALALAITALWHGPLGQAGRFASRIESASRATLDHFEMTLVSARLERQPLSRHLRLSGPADDFQRSELVRIMSAVPGVATARWTPGGFRLPLLVDAWIASIAAFLLGLLLAYLVELHRRANAHRRW